MKIINKIITILIIFFILELGSVTVNNYYEKKLNVTKVKDYINSSNNIVTLKNNIIKKEGILEIPKLKIKRVFYDSSNKDNNVNKNIAMLAPNSFTNLNQEAILLAAHSGKSNISFFHNLDILRIDDEINIYYDNYKYIYQVKEKYETTKIGKVVILDNPLYLYLTTCSQKDKNNQLIIKSELIKKERY